jgi:hypothetical protein
MNLALVPTARSLNLCLLPKDQVESRTGWLEEVVITAKVPSEEDNQSHYPRLERTVEFICGEDSVLNSTTTSCGQTSTVTASQSVRGRQERRKVE